jgi:hypothetical protein
MHHGLLFQRLICLFDYNSHYLPIIHAVIGTLLGQKDLKFLRNMYAIFFFTVPAYMLRLKHRALTGVQTVGVMTMWSAFSMYNVIRASSFHLRLAQLQRRTDRGVVVIADEPTQKASK